MAQVVPTKGSTGMFAARRVVEFMEECGDRHADVIVKTDQEQAIKFLVKDIMQQWTGAKTIVEMSPVGSSKSNGV